MRIGIIEVILLQLIFIWMIYQTNCLIALCVAIVLLLNIFLHYFSFTQISRSKKQVNEVESDSDWDSLPGDVPEPGSSPEPMKSASPQVPTHSPVPAPPKQPHSKHNASSKPANMYKNASNPVKKAGSATTFEDRTGGIWNDDDDHEDIRVSFSKEKNNNVKNNNNTTKEKKDTNRMRNVQAAEENKKPPFTDFRGI